MITKASECSLTVFIRCLFDKNYKDVEGWDNIYTEYMDISGIGATIQKDLLVQIHNLHVRIVTVPAMISFQVEYFKKYEEPYLGGFDFFKRHGHKLTWDSEHPGNFAKQLERVETIERKYFAELDQAKKQLDKIEKQGAKLPAGGNGRHQFIQLINNVGKYRRNDIDRDKTDVETYALMVKDYFEQSTKQQT